MKQSILLLLLFSVLFSYSSPPIDLVLDNNLAVSNQLFHYSLNSNLPSTPSDSSSLVSGNIDLVLLSPSIDDRISFSEDTFVFWTSNFTVFETNSQVCGVKFVSQDIIYSFNFTFQNNSKTISGNVNSPLDLPKYLQVPFSEEELNTSQAWENLSIFLNWSNTVTFRNYHYVSNPPFGQICTAGNAEEVTLSGSDSVLYYVDGASTIYLLNKPILEEQWHKNNHFDSIVFSNMKFYNAEIYLNNKSLSSFQLYNFNISNESHSLTVISSVPLQNNDSNFSEFEVDIYPNTLEKENNTFSFIYQFNSTYTGIGNNNLSLNLIGFFGKEIHYNSEILSKILTYDNTYSEYGEELSSDDEVYTNSVKFINKNLNYVLIPISFLSLFLVILLFRFRFS